MVTRRVVVTGMGVVSPVGLDLASAWECLTAGRSGIGPITLFDSSAHDVHIAGEARGFDPLSCMDEKEARRTDRFTQLALAAGNEALASAGLRCEGSRANQIGVIFGAGIGGIWTYTRELEAFAARGPRAVSPFLVPAITTDAAAVLIAMRVGARGPCLSVVSACATGTDAAGLAFEAVKRGDAAAIVTGGCEAAVTPIGVAAFSRMRALSRRNEQPEAASRPFDATRDGFVIAEGAAALVLESLASARARGAEPLAEVLGYAATSDAAHLTAPEEGGESAARCIQHALRRAGVHPERVSYISAHATGTPAGDPAEVRAIKLALGEQAHRVPVSATKSMTGHMLGAAGAFEAVACIQAIRTGVIPPTINLDNPDPECDLDFVAHHARRAPVDIALSNSFGFGGHNSCLVLGRL